MIIHGDCLEVMKSYEHDKFSSVVCDPPYGLKFMGKGWDHGIPGMEYWAEALRVTKPGGHLLAFGGTRTYHRLACAIEDAGWEIRDCIQWIYGSGFPKSHNKFGLEGYGTALKPAYEPILVCMKKCDGTFKQNVERWGLGGLNIDECRVKVSVKSFADKRDIKTNNVYGKYKPADYDGSKGRWPANVILDEEAGNMLGNPSRFFYCAKASPSERNVECESLEDKVGGGLNATIAGDTRTGNITVQKNNHPTVKPLNLMKYLITLVSPPENALILDPFCGSGSTIVAANQLGIKAIGIEKEEEYVKIANERIKNSNHPGKRNERV